MRSRLAAIIPIALIAHLMHGPLGTALAMRRAAGLDGAPEVIVFVATAAGYLLSGLVVALAAIAIPALVLRGIKNAAPQPQEEPTDA